MELHDQTPAAHELVAVIVLDGLSIDNNSPVGAPRRLKKRTKLPPAWIGRAGNVARFETWLAQQSSHNELTITWRVPPRLGGTLPKVGVTPSSYLPDQVLEVIGL